MKYHFFYQMDIACLRPIKTIAHTRTIGFVFRLLNREYARRTREIIRSSCFLFYTDNSVIYVDNQI